MRKLLLLLITTLLQVAGALKGFSSFFKNLESLLKESMQLNAHETKMVVEMIMIESKEKVQEMSKEEFIHKAESIVENKIHQSSPFCPYCLRVFDRIRERNNHVKMIHEKLSVGKFNCGQCEKSYMSGAKKHFL